MRRIHRQLSTWLVLGACLAGTAAVAGSVFLNGVNIDGVANQKFEKATVDIDAQGNVHIEAPGYAAKVVVQGTTPRTAAPLPPAYSQAPGAYVPRPPGSGPPPGTQALAQPLAQISQRYYLVTEQTARGMTDYDVDVTVNGRWIRKLYSNEEQIITDITKFMAPGRNIVSLSAKKLRGATRKSFSPEHVFRVIIGTGNVSGGDNVMIDSPVVKFVRSAAEDRDITEEFTLTTR